MKLTVNADASFNKEIRVRIPGWCKAFTLNVNGEIVNAPVEKGYAVISRRWNDGDVIGLSMEMPVEIVAADERVKADEGKRAVQRGPLVYCMEEVDNQAYDNVLLSDSTTLTPTFDADLLGGMVRIDGETDGQPFRLIPYYGWDNREAGRMKVWIDFKEGRR